VAAELCPVIQFLSHMPALPFMKKKKKPCTFTGLVSLLSECPSYILYLKIVRCPDIVKELQ
jgi:hypothetical protein